MFIMQKVGRNIVELRKKNNMTQTELADKMNVSFQAVSNWERGNSMPDISKLPELANIFGVSVDELIGEKSKLIDSVMNNQINEYLENNEVSKEELEEHIPILKPEQVETIVERIDFSKFDNINIFLPYLDNETITLLAQQKVEKEESINSFLPFLEEEVITKFAQQRIDKGESIDSYLPFLEDGAITKFAQQKLEEGESINSFLPFLEEEVTTKFAQQRIDKGESIDSYLPFLEDEAITKFVQQKLEKGESIHSFLPFINDQVLKQIVLRGTK